MADLREKLTVLKSISELVTGVDETLAQALQVIWLGDFAVKLGQYKVLNSFILSNIEKIGKIFTREVS